TREGNSVKGGSARAAGSRNGWGKRLTFSRSSYIIAAIDRVVHHSVILDLMQVRSFRIQQATGQHEQEPPARS
ncbi:MAG TPA: hypothetical protein VKB35_11580, partial [Ktedonobacteraceae bacterium]|nr:hypothetical protein [Ktedonobacteraceae bacterium]